MDRKWGYTRNQWLIFGVLGLANIVGCMLKSIQAPIFPREAREKGASATEYGLVFGSFSLTQFILSPIIGNFVPKFGVLWVLTGGMLVAGISTILFGFLEFINDRWIFISVALLLRIIEAAGASASNVSIYTCVITEFPESVATTIGTMYGMVGFAFSAGPFLGSALFQIGGFILPFNFLGGLLLLMGPLTYYVLRKTGHQGDTRSAKNENESLEFFAILRAVPSIYFYMINVFVGSINIGFSQTLLEPHLQQFHLTPIVVGLFFLLVGASGAIASPFFSYLCGSIEIPELIPITGTVLSIIGFMMIGPAPFLPIEPSIVLILIGIVFLGASIPCYLSSGIILSLRAAEESGFSDPSRTSAQISGIWFASMSLGSFAGPTIGGILYDNFGYRLGLIFILALDCAQGVSVLIFILSKRADSKRFGKNNIEKSEEEEIRPILKGL